MATTHTDLYRSIESGEFGTVIVGIYPGDGFLDPAWQGRRRGSSALQCVAFGAAEVTVVLGKAGPEVMEGGGTVLHDVAGGLPTAQFWIPEGTPYSDDLLIRKNQEKRVCPGNPALESFQYRIEPRRRMPLLTFRHYLDNMARAAVARQRELIGQR